jgi:hypothetical protein
MALLVPREESSPTLNAIVNDAANVTYPTTVSPIRANISLIDRIPGVSWVKTAIGRKFNPTYGMTEEQKREWTREEWRKTNLDKLRQNREADFKAAKYMALYHPDFYWHKYILPFEEGSEKRKRAVFLFILVNNEETGNYYGKLWHTKLLDDELEEMGINPQSGNIVTDYLPATEIGEPERKRIRKRTSPSQLVLQLSEVDRRLIREIQSEVKGLDVSNIGVKPLDRQYSLGALRARPYVIRDVE